MSARVPVLMYHAVAESPADATRTLSVRPRMLGEQLALLAEHGFTTLRFSEMYAGMRGEAVLPQRPVVLTFDDGYADFHREALPLLKAFDMTATLFVTTGWLDDAGAHAAGRPLDQMLSWRRVEEVAASGIEIGAHSHSHAQLDQLRDAALHQELTLSKNLLEDRLGHEVSQLAYPFGYSSARVRAAVSAAGYRAAASVSNTAASPRAGAFALPRLTVRRSTGLTTFEDVVRQRRLARIYLTDRALTAGYTMVRRSRYAAVNRIGRS